MDIILLKAVLINEIYDENKIKTLAHDPCTHLFILTCSYYSKTDLIINYLKSILQPSFNIHIWSWY